MPTRFLKLAKQFFAISQTVFGARDPRRTRLPPSKGKTSFAKHHKSYASSQHDLCIKPKPLLAKLKFARSFLTLATPCFAISQPVLSAKNRNKPRLPPSKGKTSFAKHPKICAFSQHNLCFKPKPLLAKNEPDRGSEVCQTGF